MIVEELVALLGFKVGNKAALNEWKSSLTDAEKSARRSAVAMRRNAADAEKGVSGVAVATGRLGLLSAAAGVAAAGAVTKGVKEFATYERQMSRIGVTAGASVAETDAAGQALQDMAQKFALPLDDARKGLDTLVASGMSLREGMSFLPSILLATQASGAETTDLANSAQKAATSFKLQASEMQSAFDIMITGGKAGQFELKDMASYIPTLASEFSTLGYTGQDGLKRLIALMQTLRSRTGTAEAAATQASNIFGKIYSEETGKKFKKVGIDVRKELEKAKKQGKDVIETFAELTLKATGGDLSKLPLFAEDKEFRSGLTTIIQAKQALKEYYDLLNGPSVAGATQRDASRTMNDTTASLQRLENSRDKLLKTIGRAVAPSAVPVMDHLEKSISLAERADKIREKLGYSMPQRIIAPLFQDPAALVAEDDARTATENNRRRQSLLRRPSRKGGVIPAFAPGAAGARDRTESAFAPFPSAGTPPAAAGSTWAAVEQLKTGMNAKIGADTSPFFASISGVQGVLRDIAAGTTARIDIDTSAAMTKLQELRRSMQGISGGASGSWDAPSPASGAPAPTPARVGGAGAAQ